MDFREVNLFGCCFLSGRAPLNDPVLVSSEAISDLYCMSFGSSSSEVLIAGAQETMLSLNVNTGSFMREVRTILWVTSAFWDEKLTTCWSQVHGALGTVIMKRGRMVCCGSSQGMVSFRDPSSLRVEHSFSAHTGTISDLDVSDNYLITCGFSKRCDPFGNIASHLCG